MNELQIFNNPEFGKIRAIEIDNEPWLVGKDAATALGYTNPTKAIRDHVSDKFKLTEQIVLSGQRRNVTLINEAGLYKLIMRSKLPNAENFSDWACGEVLPSIRKTGFYATQEKIDDIVRNPDRFIEELMSAYNRVKLERDAANAKVAILEPKADYCEKVLQSPEALNVTVIAKDYGYSAVMFNQLLYSLGIQYPLGKSKKSWTLYQKYVGKGYTVTETILTKNGITITQMKWTQKGRMFLYYKLKEIGKLPLCEREEPMEELWRA